MVEELPLQIGRYVLYDEIASGGMAKVHLGRAQGALGFSKIVAIKRILRATVSWAGVMPRRCCRC
jgi:hypothetical protein